VNITFDESLIGRFACGWPNYFLKEKVIWTIGVYLSCSQTLCLILCDIKVICDASG
jgi:hypothetical protein